MSSDLLRASTALTPIEARHRSQQAPYVLEPTWELPWPLSIITTSDAPEKWTIYENLFHSCLQTGDDRSAFECLERLKYRFGEDNERVMGLMVLYHEAVASSRAELENTVKQVQEFIDEKPTNLIMRKRKIALLRSLGKTGDAISGLNELLDVSPTDAEAWAELADLYLTQGLYHQAVYSLEEVLLITPNAWNIHARLGEVLFVLASATPQDSLRTLTRSMKSFCRSIELCDDYLRGFYGLKLSTNKLQDVLSKPVSDASQDAVSEDGYKMPSLKTIQRLEQLATQKLGEIIRRSSSNEPGWTGYSEAEVIAARALLDTKIVR